MATHSKGKPDAKVWPMLLKPEQAAEVIGVTRTEMFRLLKDGELQRVHIGPRQSFVPYEECERYVKELIVTQCTSLSPEAQKPAA